MQGRRRSALALSAAIVVSLVAGLMSLTGAADAVTLPGTNGLIVADTQAAGGGLVAINPTTGTRTPLLGSTAADGAPETNPAGNKVAFDSGGEIFTADFPAGTNRSQVTLTGGNAFNVTWSTDGSTLFFQNNATGLSAAPATASFSAGTPLVGTAAGDFNPQTAPDGTTIAYDNATGIRRIATTGGASVLLTGTAATDTEPHVSTDGAFVFFRNGATSDIDRLPYPNGGIRVAAFGGLNNHFDPFVSPDGTLVCADRAAFGLDCTPSSGIGTPSLVIGSIAGVDDDAHWQRANATGPTPTPPGGGGTFAINDAGNIGRKGDCVFTITLTPGGTADVSFAVTSNKGGSLIKSPASGTLTGFDDGSETLTVDVSHKKNHVVTVQLSGATDGATITDDTGLCQVKKKKRR